MSLLKEKTKKIDFVDVVTQNCVVQPETKHEEIGTKKRKWVTKNYRAV